MISYGRQHINQDDIDAVTAVLKSDFITQGPAVPRFEQAVADTVGARHAVAVNSATSALHVACLALDVGPNSLVWTVPNTFVASANCARYCGAEVDFVDIDATSMNMCVDELRRKLEAGSRAGRVPDVVIPVHFAGQPTPQETIRDLSEEFGFRVLEDASHSIGARRNGEPVGSCRWSDAVVFSFHPVKIVTTGEGGMVCTNSGELAQRMASLRTHGITREAGRFENPDVGPDPDPWYYEQQSLGLNYRLTDIQAALGTSQLRRLGEYVDRRNGLARRYDSLLADLPIDMPFVAESCLSAFHLYVIRLRPEATSRTQRQVFDELRRRGVGANVHYLPVHLQPYYLRLGFEPGQFPVAEAHARTALSLPLFPTMTNEQQDKVVAALRAAL